MRRRVALVNLAVLFACLLGIPAGIGAFTFVYAKAFPICPQTREPA